MIIATSLSAAATCAAAGVSPATQSSAASAARNAVNAVNCARTGTIVGVSCASAIRIVAPLSLIMNASSGPVRRKLSGTKIAPKRAVANIDKKNIG